MLITTVGNVIKGEYYRLVATTNFYTFVVRRLFIKVKLPTVYYTLLVTLIDIVLPVVRKVNERVIQRVRELQCELYPYFYSIKWETRPKNLCRRNLIAFIY